MNNSLQPSPQQLRRLASVLEYPYSLGHEIRSAGIWPQESRPFRHQKPRYNLPNRFRRYDQTDCNGYATVPSDQARTLTASRPFNTALLSQLEVCRFPLNAVQKLKVPATSAERLSET